MIALIKYLPEIWSLVSSILKYYKEIETQEKVSSDLGKIKKAFDTKDAAHLNDIFNGMPNKSDNP